MHPLKLKPVMKDYLWGGTKLKSEFGYETDKEIAAEGWILSCHKDGENIILNGELEGKTLSEALNIWGEKALGSRASAFDYFPILIKLIDAKQSLSVQVHPDDKYAMMNEGEYGKTEMWYIVDCEEGAELIYGFKDEISKEEFRKRIEDNTLTDVCNCVPVHKGDVFFITAGTLRAIGAGILIAEVQQNSNSTYRVYDFGRVGADGKPRELHIEKALDVTKCEPPKVPYGQVGKTTVKGQDSYRELAKCSLFGTGVIKLKDKFSIKTNDSFTSLLVLEGNAHLKWKKGEMELKKGDSIFIPADFEVNLTGDAEILSSYV